MGARDYARLAELARIVDLWIAPTRVGQGDLESTLALAEAFERANHRHKNGKIPLVISINAVPGAWNSTEGVDALEALQAALPNVGKAIFEMPTREREKAENEFTLMIKEALRAFERFTKEGKNHV